MRLADLNPKWFAEEGRQGQGVLFDCPSCRAGVCLGAVPAQPYRLAVAFSPPLDGGAPFTLGKMRVLFEVMQAADGEEWTGRIIPPGVIWGRTGDTFETLTITPSVDASASGHWHGFVTAGVTQ